MRQAAINRSLFSRAPIALGLCPESTSFSPALDTVNVKLIAFMATQGIYTLSKRNLGPLSLAYVLGLRLSDESKENVKENVYY